MTLCRAGSKEESPSLRSFLPQGGITNGLRDLVGLLRCRGVEESNARTGSAGHTNRFMKDEGKERARTRKTSGDEGARTLVRFDGSYRVCGNYRVRPAARTPKVIRKVRCSTIVWRFWNRCDRIHEIDNARTIFAILAKLEADREKRASA